MLCKERAFLLCILKKYSFNQYFHNNNTIYSVFREILINFAVKFRNCIFFVKMKSRITVLTLLATAVLTMTSCLSDDDTETTTYDDTAITAVSFGTLKRVYHTTTSAGKDSTYTGTFSASSYAVYIDQLNHRIYNVDSLPVGTDMEHILITVSTKNSGVATIKNVDSDTLYTISSSDSLDFSSDRIFRVFSSSGNFVRDYTVSFKAHQEYADSFTWTKVADSTPVAAYSNVKSAYFNNAVYLLGINSGNAVLTKSNVNDGTNWSDVAMPATLTANATIYSDSKNVYVFDSNIIYSSADGTTWTQTEATDIMAFVGTCDNEMYGIGSDGNMKVSTDNGGTWTTDTLDDSASFLPVKNVSSLSAVTSTNDNIYRIIMTGSRDDSYADTNAVIWSKIVDKDDPNPWNYHAFSSADKHQLPNLANLCATSYNGKILAIGGEYSQIYTSEDGGITWFDNDSYQLPSDLSATVATMSADDNGNIWIIAAGSGQVWRGHLNSATWKEVQKIFQN